MKTLSNKIKYKFDYSRCVNTKNSKGVKGVTKDSKRSLKYRTI